MKEDLLKQLLESLLGGGRVYVNFIEELAVLNHESLYSRI
jgi:hypothetical protein